MYVTLDRIEILTPDVWSFWFVPDKPVRFIPGQYIEITVPHSPMDKRGDKRWMTILNIPGEPQIGIATRFVEARSSTYKTALRALQPGTKLHTSDPIGDFVLPKDPSIPLVFVAIGIGITPMQSMVQWLNHTGERRNVQLLYLAQKPEDVLFVDTFTTGAVQFMPIVSQPPPDWAGLHGYLNGTRILELTGTPDNRLYYFSGPEELVLQLIDELQRLGIPNSQIAMDYFPGY